jgi:hypothetical protein
MSPSPDLRYTLVLVVALALTMPAVASPFSERLLRDETFWGDGRAEIVVFEATEKRYGVARPTEVRHILVREHFAADEAVKADDWRAPGAYAVIKLNQIITVPTGSYRYDQGHSAFWRADSGALIKFAQTTNDSCGLTYKQGNFDGTRWRYRAFTYWENMSEVEKTERPPAGALFYDELPFRLRLIDWGTTTEFTAPLMAGVIGSKADALAWERATFSVANITSEAAGANAPSAALWRVTVNHARGRDVFDFDAASPHALRRWERWDGTALQRRQLIRLPYWELNRPGDERYLAPGAVYP